MLIERPASLAQAALLHILANRIFNGGEVYDQMVGAGSKENIIRMVDKVAATEAPA